jgi:hypothetical protein
MTNWPDENPRRPRLACLIIPPHWAQFQSAPHHPLQASENAHDDDISACRLVSARPSSSRAATGHPAVADRPSLVSRYRKPCNEYVSQRRHCLDRCYPWPGDQGSETESRRRVQADTISPPLMIAWRMPPTFHKTVGYVVGPTRGRPRCAFIHSRGGWWMS